jgi:tyrosinase
MTTYPPGTELVVPIELSNNKIHLAIGGIQIPSHDASTIVGANGDMAENDTASFDPIFFFHHAFIDRMFWVWQTHHKGRSF